MIIITGIQLSESTDGSIQALRKNPVVSASLLKEIHSWKRSGASFDDIVDRLRLRCVPPEYVPKLWMPGNQLYCAMFVYFSSRKKGRFM